MNKHEIEFKEGQSYRCTTTVDTWFTEGKVYPVIRGIDELVIVDDEGDEWTEYHLNIEDYYDVYDCFELVTVEQTEEEEDMTTLELKEGQLYRCTKDVDGWFTKGKLYPVVSTDNGFVIIDDSRDEWNNYDVNDDFYNAAYECFELVAHTMEEQEGLQYKCISDSGLYFTKGEIYKLTQGEHNLELVDDKGEGWHVNAVNYYIGKYFEIINEKESNNMNKITFKEGQLYRCISDLNKWFTQDEFYPVVSYYDDLVIFDDQGDEWHDEALNEYLYKPVHEHLELVTVEQTEEDENMNKLKLKDGQLYKCVEETYGFTRDKRYPVVRNAEGLAIIDDYNVYRDEEDLNEDVRFYDVMMLKLVEVNDRVQTEDETMNKLQLKTGQLYKCVNATFGFTKDQYYPVVDNGETLVLIDDYKCDWTTYELNDCDFYENDVLTLVTVEQLDCEQEDESCRYEPDQVETHTITVYYPNNEKLTFYGIVSVEEKRDGELVMTDTNGNMHVTYLKNVLAYSKI